MDEPHSADELTNIRKFLERLESGYMTVRKNGVDITKREIGVLRREIAVLEDVLERLKAEAVE
jgi:polyhydroxyalkanoate synthesis regulator phasin